MEEKHKILIAYNPNDLKECEDVEDTFESVQDELAAWKIKYDTDIFKDKEKNKIRKIEAEKFLITLAPIDLITLDEADSVYANANNKESIGKGKADYFKYGRQVLVDIVLEARKKEIGK